MQHAGLVRTGAWRCGRSKAVEAFCWPQWAFAAREDTLRPRSIIGCSAWPCQLIVDLVMEIDLRPQSKRGCVLKEARSARTCTIVVLIVLNLAPPDLSEASMGCVRVRGWQCRTASPGKLVARLFRSVPWPGPGWTGTRTSWGQRWGEGSLLAACAAEHIGHVLMSVPTATPCPSDREVGRSVEGGGCT